MVKYVLMNSINEEIPVKLLNLCIFAQNDDCLFALPSSTRIFDILPDREQPVLADGYCLFGAVAAAIGACPTDAMHMRCSIDEMRCVIFLSGSLEAFIATPDRSGIFTSFVCITVDDYLKTSKMTQDGSYVTCVELYTTFNLLART